MEGVDCDWCLVCDKRTSSGATYCSPECRSSDLISSSAFSASSASSSASSSSSFSLTDSNGIPLPGTLSPDMDNYPMPPFIRKQRTSIPNIYVQCSSNQNSPNQFLSTPKGNSPSTLSNHLHQQPSTGSVPPVAVTGLINSPPGTGATQYPLFYATLNALRPTSPSVPPQNQ